MSARHALSTARALAPGARAGISPVGVWPAPDDAVVLCPRAPDPERLRELADALPRLDSLVIWWGGGDQADVVSQLSACGLEHGALELIDGEDPGVLCVLVADEAAAARLGDRLQARRTSCRALAVMPVHNEADLIHHSIAALVSDGIDVHLLDHESTDDTVAIAARWLDCGLERIERFPDECGASTENHGRMVWRDILARVQDVSREVAADWYLFVNADEFREAPWPGMTLLDGLREADELGYNAIDFQVLDFRPLDDGYVPGTDPRPWFTHYESAGRYDTLQIKAWKRQPDGVDLVGHAGHDVTFPGRRVFPVPFLLRHYPIRSGDHGRRKVLTERLPRFSERERADGWHVQYDQFADGRAFAWRAEELTRFEPERVRAEILGRALSDLLLGLHLSGAEDGVGSLDPGRLLAWSRRRGASVELEQARRRLAGELGPGAAAEPGLDHAARDLGRALRINASLRSDLRAAMQIAAAESALDAPPPSLAAA